MDHRAGALPQASLTSLAAEWGVPCDPAQAEQVDAFMALLLTWNARINLTGAHSRDGVIAEHLPDAFALASRLPAPAAVVDVGSGGGLPALPLAILRPTLSISLVEPIAKKVAFLRTAVRDLGLGTQVTIVLGRGEQLATASPARFDVAISRATFAPAAWLVLGRHLVRPGGRVFALAAPRDLPPGGPPPLLYGGGRRALVEVCVESPEPERST